MHCAPAHGSDDYLALRKIGVISSSAESEILCHIDSRGLFTNSESLQNIVGTKAAQSLNGKDVFSTGNRAILELLQSISVPGNGVLIKIEKIKHRYPYDWKTKTPVITLATKQWFANLDGVREKAIEALETVKFFPTACKSPPFTLWVFLRQLL